MLVRRRWSAEGERKHEDNDDRQRKGKNQSKRSSEGPAVIEGGSCRFRLGAPQERSQDMGGQK